MKRFAICIALITVGVPALADTLRSVPQSKNTQQRQISVNIASSVQLSPTVRASIEKPEAELRTFAMRGLNSTQQSSLERVVYLLRAGDRTAAESEWQSFSRQTRTLPIDTNLIIQHVLRQSYLENINDLRSSAENAAYFIELKEAIRNHLSDIRTQYAEWTTANGKYPKRSREQTVMELIMPSTTALPLNLSYRNKTMRTNSEWEGYIREWEQYLDKAGDDSQLLQLRLQEAMQKQAQAIQVLSNILKTMNDTAKAIIGNMK